MRTSSIVCIAWKAYASRVMELSASQRAFSVKAPLIPPKFALIRPRMMKLSVTVAFIDGSGCGSQVSNTAL